MRINDWSSDVCSSDLVQVVHPDAGPVPAQVVEFHALDQLAAVEHPGEPVRPPGHAVDVERTVALRVERGGPGPASVGLFDLRPEPPRRSRPGRQRTGLARLVPAPAHRVAVEMTAVVVAEAPAPLDDRPRSATRRVGNAGVGTSRSWYCPSQ